MDDQARDIRRAVKVAVDHMAVQVSISLLLFGKGSPVYQEFNDSWQSLGKFEKSLIMSDAIDRAHRVLKDVE